MNVVEGAAPKPVLSVVPGVRVVYREPNWLAATRMPQEYFLSLLPRKQFA
jgi:hypothetical protein